MKNFSLGFFIGIAIACGVMFLGVIPSFKKSSYDVGYAAGNIAGINDGIKTGIAKGVEQVRQQQIQDSLRLNEQSRKNLEAATRKKNRRQPEPVQNWHVIDGKLAEPVSQNSTPNM